MKQYPKPKTKVPSKIEVSVGVAVTIEIDEEHRLWTITQMPTDDSNIYDDQSIWVPGTEHGEGWFQFVPGLDMDTSTNMVIEAWNAVAALTFAASQVKYEPKEMP